MNPPRCAATPLAVERVPPGDPEDEIPANPWGVPDAEAEPSAESLAPRPTRRVGSVVDPSVADDGLSLTGPGAPQRPLSTSSSSHPVRERLLEKAQSLGSSEPDTLREAHASPSPPPTEPGSFSSKPIADKAPSPLPLPSRLPGTPPPAAVASELDRIARRSPPPQKGPGISPNMIALLGGLIGLTAISTLGVLLGRSEANLPPSSPAPVEEKLLDENKSQPKEAKPERKTVAGPWRIKDDAGKPGRRVLKGKIGKNAFLRAIQDAGLPKNEAYRAYAALKGLKDLDHCKSTDRFEALVRGSEKSLVAFEYSVNKEEVYQAKTNKEGRLEGSKLDLAVSRNQIRRSFAHDGKSFEESARRAGFDPGIAKIAELSLRGHSSLSDFKKGDRLRVIAQEVTVLGEFSRYAGIEAMEILREGEETRRIYYYSHPVEGGHFDKNGRAPYEGGWRKPIPGAPVTSKFNMKRMHPVLNKVMPHTGTDFGAPSGTAIGATAPGVISFRGPAGASGNLIKVKHDGGYESGYAHLSRFGNLHVGDKVERLQTVGYCGSTGRSTGPHLHFTMKKDNQFIDAESLNLDGLRVLPKAHRPAFNEVRSKYDPILDEVPLAKPLLMSALDASAPPAGMPVAGMPIAGMPIAGMMDSSQVDKAGNGDLKAKAAQNSIASSVALKAPALKAEKDAKEPLGRKNPVQPAQPTAPSAIFLSDGELLRMQSRSDDGEVSE